MEQIEPVSMPPGNKFRRFLVSELAAGFSVMVGLIVLTGWLADIPVFKSLLPDFVTMKVNAALCFIFAGIVLWLLQLKRETKITRFIALLFSSFVLFISTITIIEYFFSVDFGIDQLLLNQPDPYNTLFPGRMALSTAICFVLIAISLMLLPNKNVKTIQVIKILQLFVVFTLLIVILYLITDVSIYFTYFNFTGIAIPTLVTLISLVIGISHLLPIKQAEKTKTEKQIITGFFFALLVIILVGVISVTSNKKLQDAVNQVKHTHEVIQKEDEILSLLKDVESGMSGYALSGDTLFLEQYEISRKVIPSYINSLEQLTVDNPIYRNYIDSLKVLIGAKMAFVRITIILRNKNGLQAAIDQVESGKGKIIMDEIRDLVSEMKTTEGKLLMERSRKEIKNAEDAKIVMLVFIFLLIVLIALVYFILMKELIKRKQAETSLQEKVEDLRRMATVVKDSNDAVILHDLDGKILAWNRGAKITYGYTEAEALGMNVRDIVAESDREAALTLIRKIKEGEIVKSFELKRVTKKGRILDVWLTTTLLTDEQGNPVAIATTERDITERKQANENRIAKESAESANHMKSEFLANMSHEIRTPMNAILGYAELLGYLAQDKTQKNYLESIKSSGRGLLLIINDILDLSKIEAGKTEMHFEFVDTRSFFSEFKQIFSLTVMEKGVEFILDVSPGIPEGIYIDEARLRQVLFNLIGNAMKFTEKGFVKLKVHTENHLILEVNKVKNLEYIDLIIEVEDTGIGISKEFQQEIFKPFVQQQEQSTKKYGGTGLGLAITLRLVELMNGIIELHSNPNSGSIFRVKIPDVAYRSIFENSVEEFDINPLEVIFEKATIIVADNVKYNRSYIKDAFANSNLTILEAENGLVAFTMAKAIVPEMIITDIQMSVLDGFGLLEKLKADESLKHIPVIAYSASVMKAQQERIFKSEFTGLLMKPVRVSELYVELIKILPHSFEKGHDIIQPETEIALLKTIQNLPELVGALENRFTDIWETFELRQPIGEIAGFGQQLITLGNEHKAAIITEYGKNLLSAADSFDIENILKLIKQFPGIVKKLHTKSILKKIKK